MKWYYDSGRVLVGDAITCIDGVHVTEEDARCGNKERERGRRDGEGVRGLEGA